MQKYCSEILGFDVIAQTEKKFAGRVRDIIIDPQNGRLLALVIKRGGWFKKCQIIASLDIIKIDDSIMIAELANVIPLEALPSAEKVWNQKQNIVGANVVTLEKEPVGIATDFAIETTTLFMTKLIVGPSLRAPIIKQRIIPFEAIQSINHNEIVISDDELFSGATFAKPA